MNHSMSANVRDAAAAFPNPRTRRTDRGSVLIDSQLRKAQEFAPGRRHRVSIRYRIQGPPDGPVVVASGGISAGRRIDQWWADVYGPGRGLDPRIHRILAIDWLGRYWPDGRAVTTRQQATAVAAVLDHLGIGRIHAFVGASYGAMAGLAFAAAFALRVDRLVAISGAHCAHPMAVAKRHIQREIVRLGKSASRPDAGLALARALAITTYRPAKLFARRFGTDDPARTLAAIGAYLEHQGQRFNEFFDAERYLCLSESLDLHRVAPKRIRCPVTLVGVDSDDLVPRAQLRELAAAIGRRCTYREIRSRFGHDAFLKEPGFFNRLIAGTVNGERRDDR